MAELGRVNLSGCNYQLHYDLIGQNASTNTSTVRFSGVLEVTNSYVSWSRGSASVHTSGLQGIGTYYGRGSHTLITRDFDFTHDSNGNCSVYIGASLSTTFVSGDCGGTMTLPQIKRSAVTNSVTSLNDKDIEGIFKINYTKLSSSFTYKLRVSIPQIVRLETVDYNTSGAEYQLSSSAKNILFSQENGKPKYLTGNKITLGFAVETYSGGTLISSGNEVNVTDCVLNNADPIFTFDGGIFNEASTSEGGLGDLLGSSNNNVKVVKKYSNIKVTIPSSGKAIAQKGAYMVKYQVKSANKSIDIAYSSNDINIILEEPDGDTLTISAIDSRGNHTDILKDSTSGYNIVNYTPISEQSFNISRTNNISEQTKIAFVLNWNNMIGTVSNDIKAIGYKYKILGSAGDQTSGETDLSPTKNTNNITRTSLIIKGDEGIDGFNLNNSYEIEFYLADKVLYAKGTDKYFRKTVILNAGSPAVAIYKNNVALGMPYDKTEAGRIQIYKDIKVYDGNSFINLFIE